jgi:hypothetical protein
VSFAGLTQGEIFGRLFLLFYAPQFVWLLLARFFALIPDNDVLAGDAVIAGLVLVFAVVFLDARTSNLPVLPWALVAVVPLIGWWLYARARGTALQRRSPAAGFDAGAVFNIFGSQSLTLVTALSPEECAARLRSRVVSLWAPLTWFARSADRPLQGRVSDRAFALKVRHVLTRPTLLDEARGRLTPEASGTAIDVRIGAGTFDRGFAILWVGFVLFWTILVFGATRSGQDGVPADLALVPLGMISFFVVIVGVVRWIGRDDRDVLLAILTRDLEAREDGSRRPA